MAPERGTTARAGSAAATEAGSTRDRPATPRQRAAAPAPAETPAAERWQAPFTRLLAVIFCVYTGLGAVIPVIPRVITGGDVAGGRFAVGAAFAISGCVALLTRPFVGRMAQQVGSRRVVLAGGVLGTAGSLCYLLATALGGAAGLTCLLGTRVVMGAAEAMAFTAGSVLVVGLAPQQRRGQLVGWYGLAMWSGWAVGPLVGDLIYRAAGSSAVWWLAAGTAALATLLATRLPRFDAGAGAPPSRRLVPPSVLLPGTALALAAVGYAALQGFAVLHLAARGSGHGSYVLVAFGVAYVGTRLVGSRVPDRFGAGRITICCGIGEAAGLVLVGLAHGLALGVVGGVVAGAGFAILYPALAVLVLDATPEPDRGTAIGAFTSFWDLGLAAGGLVSGAVARADLPATFFVAAVAAVITAALGVRAVVTAATRRSAPA